MGQRTKVLVDDYTREIVQLYCILVIIVSDKDTGFRSLFG